MKILQRSKLEQLERFDLFYEDIDCPGAGCGFDCDQDGNVDEGELCEAARENLERCRREPEKFRAPVVRRFAWTYRHPAIGLCDCGAEVQLSGFTNTCACGRDYNSAGQLLAPREQWGEETGEHWSDIIRGDL